jgi:hypothetical protein
MSDEPEDEMPDDLREEVERIEPHFNKDPNSQAKGADPTSRVEAAAMRVAILRAIKDHPNYWSIGRLKHAFDWPWQTCSSQVSTLYWRDGMKAGVQRNIIVRTSRVKVDGGRTPVWLYSLHPDFEARWDGFSDVPPPNDTEQQSLPAPLQPVDVTPQPGIYICKVCLTRQAAIPTQRSSANWVRIWCDVCRKGQWAGPA